MPKPNSARKRKIVSVLLKEQDGRCFYCDREMIGPLEFDIKSGKQIPQLYATLDHKCPAAKGGTWHISNLVAACWDCNHKKANWVLPDSLVEDKELMVRLFRSGDIKFYMKELQDAA